MLSCFHLIFTRHINPTLTLKGHKPLDSYGKSEAFRQAVLILGPSRPGEDFIHLVSAFNETGQSAGPLEMFQLLHSFGLNLTYSFTGDIEFLSHFSQGVLLFYPDPKPHP
jgi:hypothetical protein